MGDSKSLVYGQYHDSNSNVTVSCLDPQENVVIDRGNHVQGDGQGEIKLDIKNASILHNGTWTCEVELSGLRTYDCANRRFLDSHKEIRKTNECAIDVIVVGKFV